MSVELRADGAHRFAHHRDPLLWNVFSIAIVEDGDDVLLQQLINGSGVIAILLFAVGEFAAVADVPAVLAIEVMAGSPLAVGSSICLASPARVGPVNTAFTCSSAPNCCRTNATSFITSNE